MSLSCQFIIYVNPFHEGYKVWVLLQLILERCLFNCMIIMED